ncbi:hypothetical protein BTO15_03830 [Polaribacter sejongensis]|uniref:Uncharacterized protein n=1 Tax=Polaribacter sejongensis TaxID=985043 RepID=A0ABM6PX27_9FLAO|nr:hypothetical protein BTO15_03830 [Polaribacter sejongensis]
MLIQNAKETPAICHFEVLRNPITVIAQQLPKFMRFLRKKIQNDKLKNNVAPSGLKNQKGLLYK